MPNCLPVRTWRSIALSMAKLLPMLMAMSPLAASGHGDVRHVMAGEEYGVSSRQEKAISNGGFGNQVPKDKFRDCALPPRGGQSLYDFSSEDIEEQYKVSFSDPEYTGKVCDKTYGEFFILLNFIVLGSPRGEPCLLLRLHPAILLSECTY